MTEREPIEQENDLSFRHLQLEFARIDILAHRQIQRQGDAEDGDAGAPPPFAGFHVSEADAYALLERPLGYGYEELDETESEPYERALAQVQEHIGALITHAEDQGQMTRLYRLATLMDLDRFALDALLLSLAPALDERYGQLFGYLQNDLARRQPSLGLVLDLIAPPGIDRLAYLRYFAPDAPLCRQRLVTLAPQSGEGLVSHTIQPDSSLISWLLLGSYQPNSMLHNHVRFQQEPQPDLPLLTPQVQDAIRAATANDAILVLHGPDGVARKTAADLFAGQLQRPLLTLHLDSAIGAGREPQEVVELLLRDALLTGAIPHVRGWDSCLQEDAPPPSLLTALCSHPLPGVISGKQGWQPRRLVRRRRLRWLNFPVPDTRHREHLLKHFIGDVPDDLNIALPAGQFRLATGPLRDLVETARDLAAQQETTLTTEQLFAAARAHSNPRLAELARKIAPRYTWEDLVLPDDQVALLREMVDTVRNRPLVLETWRVGEKLTAGAGLTALFFGPPGTGKTMAAEVIAGELGLDLYKIDLSSVVSKYIGETEKNLERIFNEAESSNAILFFDEADAIFGKRSEVKDAHDRYANIEISYLLQRMEAYNGVTILATNLRANLDEAFMRRLQFAVSFPFPQTEDRLHIWRTLFPPDVPRDPDIDFELLANRFEIPGGNIRNIIVSAAYLAAANGQEVTMEHIMHGVRRELQKMGRLLSEQDLTLDQ
ncbi:MAG TPA: AAA family ATPase [Candidatus Sulfomarinibacteraceae bacterium]|nr:AAA family ATPase [Candidatus Sulfomarinibacteraceae bacterium]